MPPKAIGQLTQDEKKLIIVATKMLEALHVQAAQPPATPFVQAYWNECICKELVSARASLH